MKQVSVKTFSLHDFDAQILKTLAFDTASVTYYTELASITQEQLTERREYEHIGCHPFLVLKNGKTEEKGYNCKTFFCTGYQKGTKQCLSNTGEPYGGIVEMSRRQSIPFIEDVRKDFADFPLGDQTEEMHRRIDQLHSIRCRPFYMHMFDVLVAEGYQCDEAGEYPYFSPANLCLDNWRDAEDVFSCRIQERLDEFDIRRLALLYRGGVAASSALSASSAASSEASTVTGSTVASFPDVIAGHYGYTAIMELTKRGVIHGYSDGAFRPQNTVNRAEFVHMLLSGLHAEDLRGEIQCFPDVHQEWYAPPVCAAHRLGWIQGYRDGKFRPEQMLRRDEGLKIVVASLGLPLTSPAPLPPDVADGTWFTPYARKAMELRIILEPTFRPMQLATRADAAVWMYRALRAKMQLESEAVVQ